MSLTSFNFFMFLVITMILFYVIRPVQKYILLIASIYFYINISSVNNTKLCLLILFVGFITYIGAIFVEKTNGIWKNLILSCSIFGLVMTLFVFKYAYNVFLVFSTLFRSPADFSWFKFSSVIGLSYYVLSAIGYIVDVYWGSYKAEKNIVDVFLFIFYFPQLVSGPLTRFGGGVSFQIVEHKKFDANYVLLGLRRMAFGYFKKLVISERFSMVVATIYGNYTEYSLVGIVGATLCYAIQLYTDFSGCMDIVMGASLMFGVRLPENFNAPFFSETIQEFWQRWHITLGTWFKDYLMYPLQKSKGIQKVGKWSKKRLGRKLGKKIPFYISMLVLWFLIGLWHGGTGYYFIASAGIPCIFLILSDLCQPIFKKLVTKLNINTECLSWRWFRRIRTLLLICICWMVVCANGTHNFIAIVNHALTNLWNYTAFNTTVETIGLTSIDILLMAVGVVVLYLSDLCSCRGENIFKVMDKQNYLLKVALIYLEVTTILMHGMVGTSSFIYFRF